MAWSLARLLRVGAWGLLGAYAFYLVLGNGLLNSPVGASLANRNPGKFCISWTSAVTLWPGQVQLAEVKMAGHSRRTVWAIQVDRVNGRVALFPLFRKEVRVPTLHVYGASGGVNRIDVERPAATARAGGWTLRFDQIEAADVRQVNYGSLVLRGAGRARVGFLKQMRGGPMQLLPSRVEFSGAQAWLDGAGVLQHASIAVSGEVDKHTRAEAQGLRKLLQSVATIEVDAQTSGLQFEPPPSKLAHLQPLTRRGRLHGTLKWNRGAFEPGSVLDLTMPIDSAVTGTEQALDATAKLSVDARDIHAHVVVAPGAGSPLYANLDLTIEGREIPFAQPASLLKRADGRLQGHWEFGSLRWLGAFVPGSRLVTFDGSGSVDSDLVFRHGELEAGSRLQVPAVDATAVALGSVFVGAAIATILFEPSTAGQLRARLDATMARFSVAAVERPRDFYVSGTNLVLGVVSTGTIDELKDRFQARMTFRDATVPDLRVYNRYLPQGPVRLLGGTGKLSGDLEFDGAGDVAQGVVSMAASRAGFTVGGARLNGNFRFDTRLRRADLRGRQFVIDGSRLSIDGLDILAPDGKSTTGWWGTMDLPQGRLSWGRPMQGDARALLHARDIEPLLILFAQRKNFPEWVGKLVDEGETSVAGRVWWQDDMLILDELQASNDRFEVLGQLQSRNKARSGDLFARWGKLSLGLDLQGGDRQFHVVGARKWYESQPPLRAH
jgi:hypothetical protein